MVLNLFLYIHIRGIIVIVCLAISKPECTLGEIPYNDNQLLYLSLLYLYFG